MFVRDVWTGNLLPGGTTWLSGLAGASDAIVSDMAGTGDPLFQQIKTLSHMMAPITLRVNAAISGVSNADATVDMNALASDITALQGMHVEFYNLVQQWQATNPYAADLKLATNYLAFLAEWARSVLAALPAAAVDVPNAVLDGLGNIVSHGGQVAFTSMLPWLAVGGAALYFLSYAEKSRTYRKVVA